MSATLKQKDWPGSSFMAENVASGFSPSVMLELLGSQHPGATELHWSAWLHFWFLPLLSSRFLGRSPFKFAENSHQQRGIALGKQVGNSRLGELELPEASLDAFPEAVGFLAFREVKLGGQLGELLVLDRVEILVITIDDFSLM